MPDIIFRALVLLFVSVFSIAHAADEISSTDADKPSFTTLSVGAPGESLRTVFYAECDDADDATEATIIPRVPSSKKLIILAEPDFDGYSETYEVELTNGQREEVVVDYVRFGDGVNGRIPVKITVQEAASQGKCNIATLQLRSGTDGATVDESGGSPFFSGLFDNEPVTSSDSDFYIRVRGRNGFAPGYGAGHGAFVFEPNTTGLISGAISESIQPAFSVACQSGVNADGTTSEGIFVFNVVSDVPGINDTPRVQTFTLKDGESVIADKLVFDPHTLSVPPGEVVDLSKPLTYKVTTQVLKNTGACSLSSYSRIIDETTLKTATVLPTAAQGGHINVKNYLGGTLGSGPVTGAPDESLELTFVGGCKQNSSPDEIYKPASALSFILVTSSANDEHATEMPITLSGYPDTASVAINFSDYQTAGNPEPSTIPVEFSVKDVSSQGNCDVAVTQRTADTIGTDSIRVGLIYKTAQVPTQVISGALPEAFTNAYVARCQSADAAKISRISFIVRTVDAGGLCPDIVQSISLSDGELVQAATIPFARSQWTNHNDADPACLTDPGAATLLMSVENVEQNGACSVISAPRIIDSQSQATKAETQKYWISNLKSQNKISD
jgi:hypothetical protein